MDIKSELRLQLERDLLALVYRSIVCRPQMSADSGAVWVSACMASRAIGNISTVHPLYLIAGYGRARTLRMH
jgi:hypothetical protein